MHTRYLYLHSPRSFSYSFFFFNDTATTEIYTLSLHDALPISSSGDTIGVVPNARSGPSRDSEGAEHGRSEEHTSELQSPCNLVCRLLLEKKKTKSVMRMPGLLSASADPHTRRTPQNPSCQSSL